MQFIKVVFSNIIGFDGLIILITLGNIFFVAHKVRRIAEGTESKLRNVIYKPLDQLLSDIIPEVKEKAALDLHELKARREKEDAWYQLFISVTSILPLMGILGTVIALMNINGLNQDIISMNFTKALSSTFWGIVGAIVCRIIEGTLAPIVERNRENFELLIGKIRQD